MCGKLNFHIEFPFGDPPVECAKIIGDSHGAGRILWRYFSVSETDLKTVCCLSYVITSSPGAPGTSSHSGRLRLGTGPLRHQTDAALGGSLLINQDRRRLEDFNTALLSGFWLLSAISPGLDSWGADWLGWTPYNTSNNDYRIKLIAQVYLMNHHLAVIFELNMILPSLIVDLYGTEE